MKAEVTQYARGHREETTCLVLDGFSVGYEEPLILPVSAAVKLGESALIDGAVGVGKTAVLRAICGRCHVFSGKVSAIRSNEESLSRVKKDISQFRIGVLWNDRLSLESLTVRQTLELVNYDPSISECEVQAKVKQIIDTSMLRRRLDSLISTLSGGERTMFCLACAILRARKGILLIDDLAAGLQPSMLTLAVDTLRALLDRKAIGLLFSDENPIVRDRLSAVPIQLHGVP